MSSAGPRPAQYYTQPAGQVPREHFHPSMFLRFTRPARRFSSTFVSVNGQPVSDGAGVSVSIYDESFQRGDGVFEVVRILGTVSPSPSLFALH
jgi:hypothetical protein